MKMTLDMMQAVNIRQFGPVDAIRLETIKTPKPDIGEVLVEVCAVAVNFVDTLVISGNYQFRQPFPFIPGKLPVGIVRALGGGDTNIKIGDRVQTMSEIGGYAEYAVVKANECFQMPDGMNFTDAASMACLILNLAPAL